MGRFTVTRCALKRDFSVPGRNCRKFRFSKYCRPNCSPTCCEGREKRGVSSGRLWWQARALCFGPNGAPPLIAATDKTANFRGQWLEQRKFRSGFSSFFFRLDVFIFFFFFSLLFFLFFLFSGFFCFSPVSRGPALCGTAGTFLRSPTGAPAFATPKRQFLALGGMNRSDETFPVATAME